MILPNDRSIILISSYSGHRANGAQQAARDTWIQEWRDTLNDRRVDYRFVLGSGNIGPACDEWIVGVEDDYAHLWYKNRRAWQLARWMHYGFVFQCCVDTYVRVPAFVTAIDTLVSGSDYAGVQVPGEGHASGGYGYWLSDEAMLRLNKYKGPADYEDRMTGALLGKEAVELVRLPRVYSAHLSKNTGNYDPQWMLDHHAKELARAQG